MSMEKVKVGDVVAYCYKCKVWITRADMEQRSKVATQFFDMVHVPCCTKLHFIGYDE